MNTVHKFPLAVQDMQDVAMPRGALILAVQTQRERLCLWALVDDAEARTESRRFRIAGTGHRIESALHHHYVGTFQLDDGNLVFHVFEVT